MSSKLLPKLGCYAYQKKGQHDVEEIELPLKNLKYVVELADSLAYLELEQIYANESDHILDVEYIFPVNPQAALTNFEISFGGHVTKGIVKAKEDAEKQFKENLSEGRRVGYGGFNRSSARDIMKVRIGNIDPHQQVKVKICLVHTVSIVLNTFYEFKLTTAITPRYVNGLSANSFVKKQKTGKQALGLCFWDLSMRIKSSKAVKKIFSNTHKINSVTTSQGAKVQIEEKEMLPNKDFIVYYSFQNMEKPSVLLGQTDRNTHAVVSFVPRFFHLTEEIAHKYLQEKKGLSISMSKVKAEYIFLLDRSGSMGGTRIAKAKEALIIFLKSLPQDSYFNVVSFGSSCQELFTESQKYTQNIIQKAIQDITKMDADLGGTQISDPLQAQLNKPLKPSYARHIFLLTDGAVSDTASVIQYVSLHTQFSRVHTIGIGEGCSEDLILGCASLGRGYSVFISDGEDASDKIIQMLQKSLSPVIANMKLTYDRQKIESVVPNPQKCPYILKDDIASFYLTFNGKLHQKVHIRIDYTDSEGKTYHQVVEIDPSHSIQCNYIGKMVSFMDLKNLYGMYKYGANQQDLVYYVKQINKAQLEKQIIKQSIERQILSELTAFICVDLSESDEKIKAKQHALKTQVDVKPLNPIDHGHPRQFNVSFGPDNYYGDGSQEYEDECAFQIYERPQYQEKVKKQSNIKFPSQLERKMRVIDMTNKKSLEVSVDNLSCKKISEFVIISKQQITGAWNDKELLKEVYNNDEKTLNLIEETFKNLFDFQLICTLAILQQLKLMYSSSKKVILICRKAEEYLDSRYGYSKLREIWSSRIRQLRYQN